VSFLFSFNFRFGLGLKEIKIGLGLGWVLGLAFGFGIGNLIGGDAGLLPAQLDHALPRRLWWKVGDSVFMQWFIITLLNNSERSWCFCAGKLLWKRQHFFCIARYFLSRVSMHSMQSAILFYHFSLSITFSSPTNVWLVNQIPPLLPYMVAKYASRSTTAIIFRLQKISGCWLGFTMWIVTGTGKMRVAKLRVGILWVEVLASTWLVSYF